MNYVRPIARTDLPRPPDALPLAGSRHVWFDRVELLTRGGRARVLPAVDLDAGTIGRLSAARPPLCGLSLDEARVMGILNVTPDSFSDGGAHFGHDRAMAHARVLVGAGADILDIGGESTRPGAAEVSAQEEAGRTVPVIAALRAEGIDLPVSIDTRKAVVAKAAFEAGADILNDVAALGHDAALAPLAAARGVPVCLMHAQGTPETMQDDPQYEDVLLDVYDFLAGRMAAAEEAGIARERLIVDPGIGFGKTVAHNLALIRQISLFHGLGCPILLGASRKRFIGALSGAAAGAARMPGSLAVALAAVAQGVQILRVHDVAETVQALRLWRAVSFDEGTDS